MRLVEDADGNRLFLLKESEDACLVRDPSTDERRHVPQADLEPAGGDPPLAAAAEAVPATLRTVLTALPDERALGLLLEIDARGPVSVRALLNGYDLCESDLHGLLTEFRAADLVAETRVGGERGYETTADTTEALAHLRE